MWKNENRWDGMIAYAARRTGIPEWVIKSTIAKESGFQRNAVRYESRGRASRGLMQLLGSTARGLGYSGPLGDDEKGNGGLYDPQINIMLGSQLLAQLRRRYPHVPWDSIYAAYNAGSIRYVKATPGTDRRLVNEANIHGWRRAADYFQPGWRNLPFGPPRSRRGAAGSRE